MKTRHILLLLFALLCINAKGNYGSKWRYSVTHPSIVAQGDTFNIKYIVTAESDLNIINEIKELNITLGNIDKKARLINQSSANSVQTFSNTRGKKTTEITYELTCTFVALKRGKWKVPDYSVNGAGIYTRNMTSEDEIEIIKSKKPKKKESDNSLSWTFPSNGKKIKPKLTLTATVNNKTIELGDTVTCLLKLKTNIPVYKAWFDSQIHIEDAYYTFSSYSSNSDDGEAEERKDDEWIIQEIKILPLKTGKITIPAIKIKGTVIDYNSTDSLTEGAEFDIQSKPVTIKVVK